jgi:hypothetical protein
MVMNALSAGELISQRTIEEREISGHVSRTGGGEDFSSVLAHLTGIGESPLQRGADANRVDAFRDTLSAESAEHAEREKPVEPPVGRQAETERDQVQGCRRCDRAQEGERPMDGERVQREDRAERGDGKGSAEAERSTEGQKSRRGEDLKEIASGHLPAGKTRSGKRVSVRAAGRAVTGRLGFRHTASAEATAAATRGSRQGSEKQHSSIQPANPDSVRELLKRLSWRRQSSGSGSRVSNHPFKEGADARFFSRARAVGHNFLLDSSTLQRKAETPRSVKKWHGEHASRRIAGGENGGSSHGVFARRMSDTQQLMSSFSVDRDRFTGGNDEPGIQRMQDFMLSKYEESAKSVDVKINYQNMKNVDGNFDEIVRQFNILVKNGGGEARIVLEPEHLGHLKLRIQLDRGEIATNMVVENQAVKDLIMSRLNILEESLLKHGFGLGSFEVGVKGENAEDNRSSTKAQGRKGGIPAVPVEEPVLSEGVPGQYLPWISSVVNVTV